MLCCIVCVLEKCITFSNIRTSNSSNSNGFIKQSSTPMFKPETLSVICDLAVNVIIGIFIFPSVFL